MKKTEAADPTQRCHGRGANEPPKRGPLFYLAIAGAASLAVLGTVFVFERQGKQTTAPDDSSAAGDRFFDGATPAVGDAKVRLSAPPAAKASPDGESSTAPAAAATQASPVPRVDLRTLQAGDSKAGSTAPGAPPISRSSEPFTPYDPPGADAIRERALADVASFRKAKTWQDKLPFVRQADRVAPLMKAFYESAQVSEPDFGALAVSHFRRAGSVERLSLGFHAPTGRRGLVEMELLKQPDHTWKLDWESFVAACEMRWEDLATRRPTQPILLRARAVLGSYYNYEFTDHAKYLCVRLNEPRPDGHVIFAYCEKGTPLALEVSFALKVTPGARLTVRVAFPENAQSGQCARLVEFVAKGWLLPD